MKEYLLFAVATFLQLVIGVIASITKMTKDDNSKFPLNLTVGGWSLIIAFILCFGFSLTLFDMSVSEKQELIIAIKNRDSIHQIREDSIAAVYKKQIDNSYERSIKATNEALAKYYLRYNSNQNVIENLLIDSAFILHEKLVNIKVAKMGVGIVGLFFDLDIKIDKISDVRLYITTAKEDRLSLKNIYSTRYFGDIFSKPLLISSLEIEQKISDFLEEGETDFRGEFIWLEWRDGANKFHKKQWSYKLYKQYAEQLKNGFIKLPKTSNAYVSAIRL